jgi:uncharacterized protein YybS (DUF2232 family)
MSNLLHKGVFIVIFIIGLLAYYVKSVIGNMTANLLTQPQNNEYAAHNITCCFCTGSKLADGNKLQVVISPQLALHV